MKQDLQANVGLLEAQHEQEQANAGAAVGAFESVSAMDSEHAHIPRIGWGIFGYFEKRRDDTNQAIGEADAKVATGDMAFHYAGYGWRTGTQIEQSIAATENQITDVR